MEEQVKKREKRFKVRGRRVKEKRVKDGLSRGGNEGGEGEGVGRMEEGGRVKKAAKVIGRGHILEGRKEGRDRLNKGRAGGE